MSDETNPTTETNPPASDDKSLEEKIADVLGKLLSSGKADVVEHEKNKAAIAKGAAKEGQDTSLSIAEEVKQELQRLRDAENAEQWKKGIQSEVERLKGLAEKSPIQVSKWTKFLWGSDD